MTAKIGVKQYWSMTEGVFNCLIDSKRTDAFAKAIANTVRKGDVVVDMGTGSGILALLAAKAGAKKVYAVEWDKNNLKTLAKTFAQNGMPQIIPLRGDALKIKIPEKVDVVIGEMIATALIEELQVLAMNNMLRFAKKNVRVLLNKYDTYIDLVNNNERFYGFDFNIIRYEYPDEKKLISKSLSTKELVCTYDFSKVTKDLEVNKIIDLKITKDGVLNALRLSGKTTFHDGSHIESTFAYDYPLILPLEKMPAKKGDIFRTKLFYRVNGGISTLKYSVVNIHAK